MNDEASVPLSDVLLVLRAKGVLLNVVDASHNVYLVAGNGWLEQISFSDPVEKHRLRYLSRKFGIDIYLFWNTNMLSYKPGENPN